MPNTPQRLAIGVLLALNSGAVAFSALVVWLFSVWMIDDHLALTLSGWGWTTLAMQRLGIGIVIVVLAGVALFGINALLMRRLRVAHRRLPRYIAAGTIGVITCTAMVGSFQFALTRPFM